MDKHTFFYYLLLISVFVECVAATEKICFRLNSGGIEPFCCNNHIKNNGECVECEPGTKSRRETSCEPCTAGKYGRKCSYFCNCNINERCDKTYGCLVKANAATTELPIIKLKSVQVTSLKELKSSDGLFPVEKEKQRDTTASQSYELDHTTQNTNPVIQWNDEKDVQKGFSDREILVYSMGSAIFFIFITCVCVSFLCLYKFKTIQLKKNLTVPSPDFHSDNDNTDDGSHSAYDSIDENGILDINIEVLGSRENIGMDSCRKSESDSSPSKSETSSYLHPYVTMNKNDDTHAYCSRIWSCSSGSSSVSDFVNRNSGYTHPYQQPQHIEITDLHTEYKMLYPDHELKRIDLMLNAPISDQSAITFNHNVPTKNFTSEELFELKRTKSFENNKSIKIKSGFVEIISNSVDRIFFSARPKSLSEDCENDKQKANISSKHLSA